MNAGADGALYAWGTHPRPLGEEMQWTDATTVNPNEFSASGIPERNPSGRGPRRVGAG